MNILKGARSHIPLMKYNNAPNQTLDSILIRLPEINLKTVQAQVQSRLQPKWNGAAVLMQCALLHKNCKCKWKRLLRYTGIGFESAIRGIKPAQLCHWRIGIYNRNRVFRIAMVNSIETSAIQRSQPSRCNAKLIHNIMLYVYYSNCCRTTFHFILS